MKILGILILLNTLPIASGLVHRFDSAFDSTFLEGFKVVWGAQVVALILFGMLMGGAFLVWKG